MSGAPAATAPPRDLGESVTQRAVCLGLALSAVTAASALAVPDGRNRCITVVLSWIRPDGTVYGVFRADTGTVALGWTPTADWRVRGGRPDSLPLIGELITVRQLGPQSSSGTELSTAAVLANWDQTSYCAWQAPRVFRPSLQANTEYFFAASEWPDSARYEGLPILHSTFLHDLVGDADRPDSLADGEQLARLSARDIAKYYAIWPSWSAWCANPTGEMERLRDWARREPQIAGAAPFAIYLAQMERDWQLVDCSR